MIRARLLILAQIGLAMADMAMDEPSDAAESMRNALQVDFYSRAFHWLLSLSILVIIPSLTACMALADRHTLAILGQVACGAYALIDALFWHFNDPTGHENAASRGTAWFLFFFYAVVLFNGGASYFTLRIYEKIEHSSFWRWVLVPFSRTTYKVLSCLIVICGFIKACMNVTALLGFCYDDHTGQCNAHGIMGSSFILYGGIMLMMLMVPWLRLNSGKFSQEFYDSVVITAWGIINTFTEHRPWEPWSHGDYQHTAMGILFWGCGMLGMALSWGRRRSFMPALTLIFTGYAMSKHSQLLITSTEVHAFFGYVLMFGGLSRILEISFLLDDKDMMTDGYIRSFQYLPSLALILAGVLFMGANEEQMQLVVDIGAGPSSYIMVIITAACCLHLWLWSVLAFYLHLVGVPLDGPQSLPSHDHEAGAGDSIEMSMFSKPGDLNESFQLED